MSTFQSRARVMTEPVLLKVVEAQSQCFDQGQKTLRKRGESELAGLGGLHHFHTTEAGGLRLDVTCEYYSTAGN